LKLLEDEHSLVNTNNISIDNNDKNLDKRNDSDSTLVKSISSLEQNKILNIPTTITNNKTTYNSNHNSNNKNNIIFENDNSYVNKNKDLNKESILIKKNSSSSFKTACSDSSNSSLNSFKTTKTNSSHNLEITQNEIITSTKAQKYLKTSTSAKANINTESGKSIKIYHIKKDKGYDINGSSSSISKRYKSRNSSKELASTSQYIPNHLMLSDNNSRTSFKKEEIAQKLSLSSLSITKAHSLKKQSKAIENIIGTPIKKDHVHYILMLDMLNGIRYSVQRCNASTNRELYLKDFKAKHKIALDVYNNELLPSSKYYYKFKDYAPRVFRSIREMFKISSEDYLMSLTGKYMLTEMDSPGKSGSFFYYSQDYRFIIKTVHHTEHKYLLKILRNYYLYLKKNPNTLICKIFGLHRVKIQHGNKIHFIVMENIFPPDKDIHEKYDLKGSLVGRYTNEKENNNNKILVMKDLNWIKRERKIYLGKEKENILMNQLEKDVKFLAENNVMDYSLLVGCHNLNKGNKDNIRDSTLSIIEPNPESLNKKLDSKRKTKNDPMAIALARAIAETEPVSLEISSSTLPETIPKRKKHFIFYHDDGGFRATDENNNDLQELYFLGIIDIFTNYNMKKKIESLSKSIINSRRSISSVNPTFYGQRFLKLIRNSIGHDSKVNRLRNLKPNPRQFQITLN
jgi:1-phosphatidylinositol-4-phosphate 5-kinase